MGQKVNPKGFRTGVRGCLPWTSRWFSRTNYAGMLFEDVKIREYLLKNYKHTKIDKIEIERSGDHVKIIIFSGNPSILIGKKGQDIDALRIAMSKLLKRDSVEISIQEVKHAFLSAAIVAQSIADQIEKRVTFKKAMKKTAADVVRAGAKGLKICIAGRLDGAEIARDEWFRHGSVPLHTLRANIDYALAEAKTTYGIIGIKVWICRGETYAASHV
jgi:small subunit ribosomal protein S3